MNSYLYNIMFVGYQMSVTAIGSLFIVLNKHHFDKGFFSIFSEQNYRSEMLLKYNYCYNYKLFVYHCKQEENRPKYNLGLFLLKYILKKILLKYMSKHLMDKPLVVILPQWSNILKWTTLQWSNLSVTSVTGINCQICLSTFRCQRALPSISALLSLSTLISSSESSSKYLCSLELKRSYIFTYILFPCV